MKKNNLIVFSDLHLHDWKNHNDNQKRTAAHINILLSLWKDGLEKGCPILFGGDLIHKGSEVSMYLLDALVSTFTVMQAMKVQAKNETPEWDWDIIKIYAIDGNHDQDTANRPGNRAHNIITILGALFPDVIMNIAGLTYPIAWGKYRIWGIPFLRYNDGLEESINILRGIIHGDFINILMIHTVLPGSTDTDDREIAEQGKPMGSLADMFDGFDLILCGHIHKHYYFGGGIYNIGAPIQQRLTDMGSRMGWLLVGKDAEIVTKITPANLPEFKFYKDGEPKDDFNFWVKVPEEKTKGGEEIPKPHGTSMKSLVRGYGKAMGFKGREEELNRLTKLLEENNND